MTFRLSKASRETLAGVHPDMVSVVERAIALSDVDFRITEGLRTVARQRKLMAAGASKTMNSRHITGHAVDVVALVGREVRWDWPLYSRIAVAFKAAAAELGVAIVWGGDWRTFKDGPHFELDRRVYP
jgi:peptidoglycan L-alanyl-D-glutamate endopeptidase CwlK